MFSLIKDILSDETRVLDEIRAIEVPQLVAAPPKASEVVLPSFDENANLLDPGVRDLYKNENPWPGCDIISPSVVTTNTLAGFLINTKFTEEHIINECAPDDRIVLIRCNFGMKHYDKYEPPKQKPPTAKQLAKKPRKKQGAGTDFNSQITMYVRTGDKALSTDDEKYPSNTKVYKVKIFRNGKIQIPGCLPSNIDDVIKYVNVVAAKLNAHLHVKNENPENQTRLMVLTPVMKNFKMFIRMESKQHLVDIRKLRALLDAAHPSYVPWSHTVKDAHVPDENKLLLTFYVATPLKNAPKKRVCVNVFLSGKINILGALNNADTKSICEHLSMLFHTRPALITKIGRLNV